MPIYSKKRKNVPPAHPGEVLKNVWLKDLGISQIEFARMLYNNSKRKVAESTIRTKLSEVINKKRSMSADFALLVGRTLNTNPKMWMNLQISYDLWYAEENEKRA